MTNAICLDANIIFKLLIKEKDSIESDNFFTKCVIDDILFTSPIFAKFEIYSILRKKEWQKENKEFEINNAIENFGKLKISYVDQNDSDLNEAYDLAKEMNLPVVYDCLYLALAKKLDSPFVTEDLKFLAKAKKVYKQAFSLKEVVGKI